APRSRQGRPRARRAIDAGRRRVGKRDRRAIASRRRPRPRIPSAAAQQPALEVRACGRMQTAEELQQFLRLTFGELATELIAATARYADVVQGVLPAAADGM